MMNHIPLAARVKSKLQRIKQWCRGPQTTLVERCRRALEWAQRNTAPGAGVKITHRRGLAYPEVSGYYIPTLLKWGEKELALQYARWLVSIQNKDGSWSDAGGKEPYTFDTGQILKGLFALVHLCPEFKGPIVNGCDWVLTQIQASGRVVTPDVTHWALPDGRLVPEAIHLYALEPVREAGRGPVQHGG